MSSSYKVVRVRQESILISFDTAVAIYDHYTRKLTLGPKWDYSRTTVGHVGRFIQQIMNAPVSGSKNIQKGIDMNLYLYDPNMN